MTATATPELAKRDASACCASERSADTRKKVFLPRTDIFETKDHIVVVADMPGVDEKSVDITLEKSVLTVRGAVQPSAPEGFRAAYLEYAEGDYERAFTLGDEVDRDSIQASVKNGVVSIKLAKAGPAQSKRIEVKAS